MKEDMPDFSCDVNVISATMLLHRVVLTEYERDLQGLYFNMVT